MKKLVFIIVLLIGTLSLYSQQEFSVKFYLDDGKEIEYKASEIEDIEIISGNSDFTMLIYQQESQIEGFLTRDIESITFDYDGVDKVINIIISGSPNSYRLALIDSINFFDNALLEPHIENIEPVSGLIGDEITLTGTDFGYVQGNGFVSFNGVEAVDYLSWNNDEIVVKVPENAASGKVSVTIDNEKKSNEVDFEVITGGDLKLISINPKSVKIGEEVTLKGTKFGAARGESIVTFNGVEAAEYSSWSDMEIKVVMPKGAKTGKASVTVDNETSNEVDFSTIP